MEADSYNIPFFLFLSTGYLLMKTPLMTRALPTPKHRLEWSLKITQYWLPWAAPELQIPAESP